MASIEPWQLAEIPGPKKAAAITRPEVIDALLKRSTRPVLVIGHRAEDIQIGDRKMIDHLIDMAEARGIPVIATADTNRALLERGYTQATIMPAVDVGQRLTDPEWAGLDGKGPYDLAFFAGLPYNMAATILNGLKHYAPQVRTVSLDTGYQPNASFSFTNCPAKEWLEKMGPVIGHKGG